jgi:cell division transport system permease protein
MVSKVEEKYSRRRYQSSYITTMVSITLVLFMLGILGLIILHANKLSDYVKENIGFRVYMKENVKEAGIIQLQKALDASVFIKSTEYITPDQAAAELSEELGEDFIGFLGYNPLPPALDLRLKADYANIDSLQMIEDQLMANSNVKEVFYQRSLVHLINKNIRKISLVIGGFTVLLLIIAIALINNTIRLSVYARRFIIKSMQLVGATQGFIRRPFIWKGIAQGFYSSLITILLLVGILYLTRKEFPELVNLQDLELFLSLFGLVIILGVLISWFSTYFAVRKYLRIKGDNLYY